MQSEDCQHENWYPRYTPADPHPLKNFDGLKLTRVCNDCKKEQPYGEGPWIDPVRVPNVQDQGDDGGQVQSGNDASSAQSNDRPPRGNRYLAGGAPTWSERSDAQAKVMNVWNRCSILDRKAYAPFISKLPHTSIPLYAGGLDPVDPASGLPTVWV